MQSERLLTRPGRHVRRVRSVLVGNQFKHPDHYICCPRCGQKASLVTGEEMNPWRADLSAANFYVCCGYIADCRPGTTEQSSPLETHTTRRLRAETKNVFKRFWPHRFTRHANGKEEAEIYLAAIVGVRVLDLDTLPPEKCRDVYRICSEWLRPLQTNVGRAGWTR